MQLHCLLASSMVKENSYQSEIFLLIEFVLSAQSQIPFSINNWSSGILSWYTKCFPSSLQPGTQWDINSLQTHFFHFMETEFICLIIVWLPFCSSETTISLMVDLLDTFSRCLIAFLYAHIFICLLCSWRNVLALIFRKCQISIVRTPSPQVPLINYVFGSFGCFVCFWL